MDLTGQYTIETKKKKYELRCKTMIDPVAPSSAECRQTFDSTWLARYPRPQDTGFDNGREFKKIFHH